MAPRLVYTPGDKRVTKQEYMNYTRHHEPDLYDMANNLYDVFDHNGDRTLELSDFMHLYLQMNSNGKILSLHDHQRRHQY